MKKLLTVAAVAVMALGIAACKPQQAGQENAPATEQPSGTEAAKPSDNAAGGATSSDNNAAPAEQNKDASGTSGSTDSSAPAEQSQAPAGQ